MCKDMEGKIVYEFRCGINIEGINKVKKNREEKVHKKNICLPNSSRTKI
ncbi:hypothetical protein METP2_02028 [Methanosarcinales archaeon]|nr:hypothetical protein METP2_02028 [Methanosarcinales archaeon]